jgi:hypothetical protein
MVENPKPLTEVGIDYRGASDEHASFGNSCRLRGQFVTTISDDQLRRPRRRESDVWNAWRRLVKNL